MEGLGSTPSFFFLVWFFDVNSLPVKGPEAGGNLSTSTVDFSGKICVLKVRHMVKYLSDSGPESARRAVEKAGAAEKMLHSQPKGMLRTP